MADPIPYPDIDETSVRPDRAATSSTRPRTPRWVIVTGIILLALLLMFVIMMLSGGNHGPGRHMSSGVTEYGVQALVREIGLR
jgi:hypothetical protein